MEIGVYQWMNLNTLQKNLFPAKVPKNDHRQSVYTSIKPLITSEINIIN